MGSADKCLAAFNSTNVWPVGRPDFLGRGAFTNRIRHLQEVNSVEHKSPDVHKQRKHMCTPVKIRVLPCTKHAQI